MIMLFWFFVFSLLLPSVSTDGCKGGIEIGFSHIIQIFERTLEREMWLKPIEATQIIRTQMELMNTDKM